MNYYDNDNYEADAEYAKEVYWESKGMGRNSVSLDPKPVVMANCPKCNREGEIHRVAIHFLQFCYPSKN